jgi:hypothetical protein
LAVLPRRRDPLFLLARYQLEVEGERFPVSAPRPGDPTRAAQKSSRRWTFGLAAADVSRLAAYPRHPARLLGPEGEALLRLCIDRVDPRLAVLHASAAP